MKENMGDWCEEDDDEREGVGGPQLSSSDSSSQVTKILLHPQTSQSLSVSLSQAK